MTPGRNLLPLLAVACPLFAALSLFLGHGWQDPAALFEPGNAGILALRSWRVITGIIVGSSLAVVGAALQAVLRNPLADPYVLGTSSGAGLAAALCIHFGLASSLYAIPLASFSGAARSLLLVYLLARAGNRTTPHTLVLAGVAWAALCGSLLMFVVSRSTAAGIHAITWWFLGDLQAYDTRLVLTALCLNLATMTALWGCARPLNALSLGDEAALHVGLAPERTKARVLLIAAILTAASVSISGLISFVGIVVPHVARALVGAEHRRLIPASALLGGAFLAVADGLGRLIFYPGELPVGILTATVGAPFFLMLLKSRQKGMWIS